MSQKKDTDVLLGPDAAVVDFLDTAIYCLISMSRLESSLAVCDKYDDEHDMVDHNFDTYAPKESWERFNGDPRTVPF